MARRRRERKHSKLDPEQAKAALNAHIRELGLASITDYKDWCRQHSFSAGTNKSDQQLRRERLLVMRQTADSRLAAARQESRNTSCVIGRIFRGELDGQDIRNPRLQAIQRAYETSKKDRLAKRALQRLLLHAQASTELLNDRRPLNDGRGTSRGTFIDGLTSLAFHWRSWIRELETWRPKTHNSRRQFTALARHLVAQYDVPAFMDSAWFNGTGQEARDQQRWFIHIGRGQNIRTANLPIPFTKRMAHHFCQAPNEYSIEAALRWGQIHGWGGDARLANAIRETRLCDNFDHDDFWGTVLRFLIDNPMLDPVHIGPIVDYLHHQRFVTQEVFVAPGILERRPPPQPNLCLKGRTAASLLRQVLRWHQQLGRERHSNLQWPKSGIGGFEFVEGRKESGNMKRWTIRELLGGQELIAEGRRMRHCVASYAGSCARRATSIWSMQLEDFEGQRNMLTIEVRLVERLICQARGKYNARPTDKLRNIVRRWAAEQNLTMAGYV